MLRRLCMSAALAGAIVAVGGSAQASAPPAPTFDPNLLLPHSAGAAEPSIRTDGAGRSFVIGPTGVPAGCKAWRVAHDGSSATYLGYPDGTVGGGDCDWAVGPTETGASANDLAYSSLTLANITTGKSSDGATTFGPPNAFSQQVAGDDRMWMAADPKPNSRGLATVFMTYHDVTAGEIQLGVSTDGGQTYVQNSPVINATEVPYGQWAGASAGNELGNVVARRDPLTGALTLYTIFETPDSTADNTAQGIAGTFDFNRVYEAVGTVTGTDLAPVVTWNDYEIWHGPVGARYNRIFPVTAVDSAGHVYAVFADGNHVYFKSDVDGTHWNPAAAPTAVDQAAGLPTAYDTAIMPWVVAGGAGMVDVVWYGASGGSGAQPNPNDDPANKWVVWLAQTADGGSTWTAAQASDHVIHTGSICINGLNCNTASPPGDRTLADFFQVALDPTNGAATIAYADDHAAPGTPVVYYTRQCSGTSATTGAALANDCVAPPAPAAAPQGSTCPGPQIVDWTGDAPNNYPGGDGSNVGSLDIVNGSFAPGTASDLKVTLTLQDLEGPPPPANLPSAFWRVYWSFGGVHYAVEADANSSAVTSFTVGTIDSNGNYHAAANVAGTFRTGPNGTITWDVPLADVGSPPATASLTDTFAEDHGAIQVAGTGLYYTAAADRAPDGGFGANANVGGCPASTGGGGSTSTTSSSTTGGSTTTGGSSTTGGGGSTTTTTTTTAAAAPSSGGSSSAATTTTAAPSTTTAQQPPAPGGGSQSGVAGARHVVRHVVRAVGFVRAVGRTAAASIRVDLSRGPLGKVVYLDRARHVRFHSLRLASVSVAGRTATLRGLGLLNGRRVAFRVVLVAGTRPHVSVVLGAYARSGALVRGFATVR